MAEPGGAACGYCAFGPLCRHADSQTDARKDITLNVIALKSGDYLFHGGDPFESLFNVQSGCLKTSVAHADAREHVLNFHLPGEMVGLDAVYLEKHTSDAIALCDSTVCFIPFREVVERSKRVPGAALHLMQTFSRDSFSIGTLTGDFSAEERMAGFLVSLSARIQMQQGSGTDLILPMSRTDIANHLRLATETVSRVLARFQGSGWIDVDRKRIKLLDLESLSELASSINPYARFRKS